MASPRFYRSNGWIYVRYYPIPKKEFKYFLNLHIEDKHWNDKRQRVRASHPAQHTMNKFIDSISDLLFVETLKMKSTEEGVVYSGLRAMMDKRIKGTTTSSFVEYFNTWIEHKKLKLKQSSIKSLKSKVGRIIETYPNNKTFDDFNGVWRKKSEVELLKKYSRNYVSKIYSALGEVLKSAYEDELTTNRIAYSAKWSLAPERIESIYLTVDQIKQLYYCDKYDPITRSCVDVFIIGCLTGQRVSDFIRIDNSMRYELPSMDKKFIRIKQKKTGSFVTIPLTPMLEDLLNKDIEPIYSQLLNRKIKFAAEIAGLDIDSSKLSSHTARRSFATNMILSGVPMHLVMKMTGHTTEKSFRAYVRFNDVIAGVEVSTNEEYLKYIEKFN